MISPYGTTEHWPLSSSRTTTGQTAALMKGFIKTQHKTPSSLLCCAPNFKFLDGDVLAILLLSDLSFFYVTCSEKFFFSTCKKVPLWVNHLTHNWLPRPLTGHNDLTACQNLKPKCLNFTSSEPGSLLFCKCFHWALVQLHTIGRYFFLPSVSLVRLVKIKCWNVKNYSWPCAGFHFFFLTFFLWRPLWRHHCVKYKHIWRRE